MRWILNWSEAAEAGSAVAGGKGWNLGRLHRYGFPVPVGGVVVAGAYLRFMGQPEIAANAEVAAGLGARAVTAPETASRLEALQAAIAAAPLPDDMVHEIESFLENAGLAGAPVAVRSSATAEDGAEASFAGIHQSFLGVRGPAAVAEAIKRCYASLWTPQAIAYRRHRHLSDEAVACAVVICAMVTRPGQEQPASAGVAFTCDPKTGRRDLITINAAPGLGEAVVSGSVNPEEIAVRKHMGRYHLLRRQGSNAPVLTDDQALALARLADRVHWAFADDQGPQDVEWAHDGRRFWLLQARPVTRLPAVTFPGAERLPIIWSNANLKDAVAGVQSTLSWSYIKYVISHALHSSLPLTGYPVPEGLEVVRRFDGRAYFDLTAMMWSNYDAIGFLPADYVRGLGGHQPLIPVPPGDPFKGPEGTRRRRAQLRFVLNIRREAKQLPRHMAELKPKVRALLGRITISASAQELLDVLGAAGDLAREFAPHFQAANMNAGLWPEMMRTLLKRFRPDRAEAMVLGLLAGSGRVSSAEHGYRLYDLARAAAQEPLAVTYLTGKPIDPQGWRDLPEASPFRRGMAEFLDEFGHRAVYEGELANPRWREDPTYLLGQIRDLALAGKFAPPRASAAAARKAVEAEVSRLPFWVRPLVRWMAKQGQGGAAQREGSKSALGSIAEPARMVFLEAGRRMAAAGVLDEAQQVFRLSAVEVEMFLRGEWDGVGARTLAADRAARDQAWRAAEPPDAFILDHEGRPAELPAAMAAPAPAAACAPAPGARGVLTGIGVAAGRATGPARVIRHPSEGHLLQDGEVLVAPSTDPGWTPLFLRASAVVMEVGGYLSHGAIVAREYGIPAVVNLPGLLGAIRYGQRLIVDGDAGTLTLLDRADVESRAQIHLHQSY
ncbi:MAG: pyruvate phosphate dikinase PEP/pyruvate-binding [Symbiobacteriaceae bacterium]|nr:pyruvate phosphate dikinase PEP/pyruvate-binding [Symbiobacteriaceae bacterium]